MRGTKLDLERLIIEIRQMKRWQPLYKILKVELSKLGYWKEKKRGNPKLGYSLGWGKHNAKDF